MATPAQKQRRRSSVPLTALTLDEPHPGGTGSARPPSRSILPREGNAAARRARFTQRAAAPGRVGSSQALFCLFKLFSRSVSRLRSSQHKWRREYINAARLPDVPRKGIISDSRRGAQSIFPRTETDTALSASISARHPSASRRSLTASERRVTASGASPFIFVRQAAA